MNQPVRPRRRLVRRFAAAALSAGAGIAGAAAVMAVFGGCTQNVQTPKPEPTHYGPIADDPNLPGFLQGSVAAKSVVTPGSIAPYPVSSYALVGQLRGTGDCTAPSTVRQYMVKEMLRRGFGDPLVPGFGHVMPGDVLRDKNYAIVIAEGDLPPGARKGGFFDVRVGCLPNNDTKSLAHGVLFMTDLKESGADRDNPTGATRVFAQARGPIFVNPAYALDGGRNPTGPAKLSLRNGVVMYNGAILQDRPIMLQMRHPERRTTRLIEERINNRFQDLIDRTKGDGGPGLAEALDEGIVQIYVPHAFGGDWEHFVGAATHLYLETSPQFVAAKAKQLVEEAQKDGAPLEDISYCWEGLGKDAMPFIQPLITHPKPDVAFAAARAAVFIGDDTGASQHALVQMARTPLHPFRLSAVQTLGALPPTSELNHLLRTLLDSDQATVRIEAYRTLARNNDPAVYTTWVHPSNNTDYKKFALDIVPSEGPPLIYATQRGKPRIAVIGKMPELRLPATFVAMNGQFTITSTGRDRVVTLYYRDASEGKASASFAPGGGWGRATGVPDEQDHTPRSVRPPVKVTCPPDAGELIARLGGAGERDEEHLDLTYGEVVSVLQKLADPQNPQFYAMDTGGTWGATFILQEPARLQNIIREAPVFDAGATAAAAAAAPPPGTQSLGPTPLTPGGAPPAAPAMRLPVGAPK